MPELPEVETVRRDLEQAFVGCQMVGVEAPGLIRLRRHSLPSELRARTEGRTLMGVGRWGKYLLLGLDSGDDVVVHLGMSGQLRAVPSQAPTLPHTHVVVTWAGAGQLRLVDPRAFGELFVTDRRRVELAHLGVDAMDPGLTARRWGAALAGRRVRLKALLMDQRFVAGIGNLYADEILWSAKLGADGRACDLTSREAGRLWRAMRVTLTAAIEYRGSSLADAQYRDLAGAVGRYQAFHQAYGREGLACRRCRSTIVRVRAGGRSAFSCPRCQR